MRKLIITRKKNLLTAIAVKFAVKVDGQPVGILSNGGTLNIPISEGTHTLSFVNNIPGSAKAVPPVQTIPAGRGDCTAMVEIKSSMGGLKAYWDCTLTCEAEDPRKESIQLLAGFLMLEISKKGPRSTEAKMLEFRRAGLDLHVRYSIDPTCVTVSPDERTEGRMVGEPFTLDYQEMTDLMQCAPVGSLTMAEREQIAESVAIMDGSAEFAHLNIVRNGTLITASLK